MLIVFVCVFVPGSSAKSCEEHGGHLHLASQVTRATVILIIIMIMIVIMRVIVITIMIT